MNVCTEGWCADCMILVAEFLYALLIVLSNENSEFVFSCFVRQLLLKRILIIAY